MKATPTNIASDYNDVSTASVSKAGDVMMTSSDQKGNLDFDHDRSQVTNRNKPKEIAAHTKHRENALP